MVWAHLHFRKQVVEQCARKEHVEDACVGQGFNHCEKTP